LTSATEAAPYGINLIVHKSNTRLQADLDTVVSHKVPVVITSLGLVPDLIAAVRGYGGLVLHDVISPRHAAKAIEAGVDGVIAVAAGAGGHAGTINPFALLDELRPIVGDKMLVLAGSISNGRAIAGACAAGADMAYMGTRIIATQESLASDEYKQMLLAASSTDIVYTSKFSGVNANFMKQSIIRAGLNLETLEGPAQIDINGEVRAWKTIWSAGHGVGAIQDIPLVGELIRRLKSEYNDAVSRLRAI
jgi:nitronate monooxygenase